MIQYSKHYAIQLATFIEAPVAFPNNAYFDPRRIDFDLPNELVGKELVPNDQKMIDYDTIELGIEKLKPLVEDLPLCDSKGKLNGRVITKADLRRYGFGVVTKARIVNSKAVLQGEMKRIGKFYTLHEYVEFQNKYDDQRLENFRNRNQKV